MGALSTTMGSTGALRGGRLARGPPSPMHPARRGAGVARGRRRRASPALCMFLLAVARGRAGALLHAARSRHFCGLAVARPRSGAAVWGLPAARVGVESRRCEQGGGRRSAVHAPGGCGSGGRRLWAAGPRGAAGGAPARGGVRPPGGAAVGFPVRGGGAGRFRAGVARSAAGRRRGGGVRGYWGAHRRLAGRAALPRPLPRP